MAPSTVHEMVLLWLRDDPSQLAALLALTHHAPCPVGLVVEDSALRAAFPVEVTPDLVLRDPGTGRWLLVEVPRRPDEAKARRWPLAMAAMADRNGPDGDLLVITSSRAVARWAVKVADHRRAEGRWGVRPIVLLLGATEADALLDRGPPELAVFAAWVMQGRRGPRAVSVVRRALERAAEIQDARLRHAIQRGILGAVHPSIVEKVRSVEMIDINQLPTNPALERWIADITRAKDAQMQAREAEMLAKAVASRAEGEARMLVRILRRRGLDVSPAVEARVLATADTALLETWADRALSGASIDDVFAEP